MVLVLGRDRFGSVNELFGHASGDELLRMFAERMGGFVRETDTVARLGRDQFVVPVAGLQDPVHLVNLAHKILRSLANTSDVAGQGIRVTASIGIALYHPDFLSPEHYLNLAFCAMDVAKEEGRNTNRLHTETLDELFRSEIAIGTDLHHAMEDEDLEVYFQPQVDLRTKQAVGLIVDAVRLSRPSLLEWRSARIRSFHLEFGCYGKLLCRRGCGSIKA